MYHHPKLPKITPQTAFNAQMGGQYGFERQHPMSSDNALKSLYEK
jgi:hypothetical protein